MLLFSIRRASQIKRASYASTIVCGKYAQHLPPKVVCRAEDFYAVRPEGQPRDQRIETDILSPIEGAAARLIRKLESGEIQNCARRQEKIEL
jgi:hypothetical protein